MSLADNSELAAELKWDFCQRNGGQKPKETANQDYVEDAASDTASRSRARAGSLVFLRQ